jgi:hypothetical protein
MSVPQKGTVGSNPTVSATIQTIKAAFYSAQTLEEAIRLQGFVQANQQVNDLLWSR